ncbi:MAG: hypothetical protein N3G22_01960 [Candidatus Micrarchaeota archaeon]|nr:hypothetical protein [Candidatus Micrarchaeota archaeon]
MAVPHSCLENRGKRPFYSLLSKAAKLRFKRVCSIHSQNGKPASLSFLCIDGEGKWSWAPARIKISRLRLYGLPRKARQSQRLRIKGARARLLRELIKSPSTQHREDSLISASSKRLEVFIHGKKAVEAEVEYEKQPA